MGTIVLEAHICDQRRSYKVSFEGPNAETMAINFMDARSSTHAINEWLVYESVPRCDEWTGDFLGMIDSLADDQPYLINGNVYPTLYERLHPTCEHGLSADLCYGPAHYASDYEISQGW
jgi:hypothetical protein